MPNDIHLTDKKSYENILNKILDRLDELELKRRNGKKRILPKSVEEVITYFIESGYSKESAVKFFKSYSESNWCDAKGNPIYNWKQKAINVWFKPEDIGIDKKDVKKIEYENNIAGRKRTAEEQQKLLDELHREPEYYTTPEQLHELTKNIGRKMV